MCIQWSLSSQDRRRKRFWLRKQSRWGIRRFWRWWRFQRSRWSWRHDILSARIARLSHSETQRVECDCYGLRSAHQYHKQLPLVGTRSRKGIQDRCDNFCRRQILEVPPRTHYKESVSFPFIDAYWSVWRSGSWSYHDGGQESLQGSEALSSSQDWNIKYQKLIREQ